MNTISVATWNLKQAVAPKKPLDERWVWADQVIGADVYALTEAKVPDGGPPTEWAALWEPEGFGPRRRWGTVLATRAGIHLEPVTEVGGLFRRRPIELTWPAGTQVADVLVGGRRWATVVAAYAITLDHRDQSCGSGHYSFPRILKDLEPLIDSRHGRRLVIAGDFNLWPFDIVSKVKDFGLVDLIEQTATSRPPLKGCANCGADGYAPSCGHIWTHKNGNSPRAQRQQIDFILASPELSDEVESVVGGPEAFPDAWEISDHAPVVATFRLPGRN
jgi:hypothetical protein